jgi:hypothetical protein
MRAIQRRLQSEFVSGTFHFHFHSVQEIVVSWDSVVLVILGLSLFFKFSCSSLLS